MRSRKLTYFAVALDYHMAARGYNGSDLAAKIDPARANNLPPSQRPTSRLLEYWRAGELRPFHRSSFHLLEKLEAHFALPDGYFQNLDRNLSPTKQALTTVNGKERSLLRWHLPDDFDDRPNAERQEILAWISNNVLAGHTEYGKYQSSASGKKFAVVFPTFERSVGGRRWMGDTRQGQAAIGKNGGYGTIPASARLAAEMADLIAFKTAAIAPSGYRRYLRWSAASANIACHRYGHIFGALTAAPFSAAAGHGVPMKHITFGLLVFPAVWDWYLYWCERRRGFFSVSERSALYEAKSLTREYVGWLRQHPNLATRLHPIPGLVSVKDIKFAKRDWGAACDHALENAIFRIRELAPVTKVHRDTFAPILTVLSNKNPLGEYVRISDEILRLMPAKLVQPFERACAVRTYLIFRFAVHLGIRQRNLRELMICFPGDKHRTTRELEELRCGELRWNKDTSRWEVFIPALAFKNGRGGFFKGRPFQMVLPNIRKLYSWITEYLNDCRPLLLRGAAKEPGTFFVRHMPRSGVYKPEFEVFSFYDTWKLMIQRYGIYNPYTQRGAIKGLLPHGPHNVRDILATHLLKKTGSYELASFAIQDSVEAVMRYYARFLPHEKTARAAIVLNEAWRRL